MATSELGIPGVVLMENAGRNAASVVLEVLRDDCHVQLKTASVAVLAGGGNNGGDGYVVARHLYNHGVAVTVYVAADPAMLIGDAAVNHAICVKMRVPMRSVISGRELASESSDWTGVHVVVDALLGTGFSGTVRPHLAAVIQRCNALEGPLLVSVDVPSGLDCDTGCPSNATVRADVTVTFVAQKRGMAKPQAQPYTGRVIVADIGTPPQLIDRVLGAG